MNYGSRQIVFSLLIIMIPLTALGVDIPTLENCSIDTRATEDVSIMICPGCDGHSFSEAQVFGGNSMDATIEVFVRNALGQGIANIWRGDIWIDSPNLCWGSEGAIADHDTDENGYTEFALPPCGGGCSENLDLEGFLVGLPFLQNPLPHIKVNSPDFNCDLVVDLVDLSIFAAGYFGPYSYCQDFFWDGVLNLVDLAHFSAHYGH